MRRKLLLGTLGFMGIACAIGMRYKPTSLAEKLCSAQVIAIGKISGIRKQYMSITYARDEVPEETYYDLGNIRNAMILKSDRKISPHISVLFQSAEQPTSNRFGRTRKAYAEGDEGIWRLRRDIFSGSYHIEEPEAPFPMTTEQEIRKLLAEGACKAGGPN
jgi:hypothetical protein